LGKALLAALLAGLVHLVKLVLVHLAQALQLLLVLFDGLEFLVLLSYAIRGASRVLTLIELSSVFLEVEVVLLTSLMLLHALTVVK